MNNEEIIKQYREQLLKVHASTVAIVSIAEILAYFIFVHLEIESLSVKSSYLWEGVVIPICINIIAHLVARGFCKANTASYRIKNYSVIYAAIVTSFVVSFFHRDYLVTSCAYVFPIVLSAMYNDKNILRQSLWSSVALISVTVADLFFENKFNLDMFISTMVIYGIIVVSYLSGEISVRFSQRNFALIEMQAVENSKLEVEIDMDKMTGLYNHTAFGEFLAKAVEKSNYGEEDCCLAMIDIDDFKKVNDTYGHTAGDTVLITLADVLKSLCDEGDFACRYGGEEFALILQGKSLEEAENIVRVAMKRFSEIRYAFTKRKITFSTGIAILEADESKDSFFERADDYLYCSKKNGKNRITL